MRKQVFSSSCTFLMQSHFFVSFKEKYVKLQFLFYDSFKASWSQKSIWRQIRFIYIANFFFSTVRDFFWISFDNALLFFVFFLRCKMSSLHNLIFWLLLAYLKTIWKHSSHMKMILFRDFFYHFDNKIILMRKLF
jgi:hypothetical protein